MIFYDSHEEYVFAIAEAMRHEYEAIANAGAIVQLDCPDLAMGRHSAYATQDLAEFQQTIGTNIAALNHAVRNIPEEQLRMHLCWGNYPGPHHHDVPIKDIIDIVWTAKPQTVLVEGANSRHAHEWAVLKELGVPPHKKLCPGLIEPQSNYIEHPDLVAQRLMQWAQVIDPERLMAGVDCGFSVHVGSTSIDPDVAFAKLASLAPRLRNSLEKIVCLDRHEGQAPAPAKHPSPISILHRDRRFARPRRRSIDRGVFQTGANSSPAIGGLSLRNPTVFRQRQNQSLDRASVSALRVFAYSVLGAITVSMPSSFSISVTFDISH